jgi:hypothetical protein
MGYQLNNCTVNQVQVQETPGDLMASDFTIFTPPAGALSSVGEPGVYYLLITPDPGYRVSRNHILIGDNNAGGSGLTTFTESHPNGISEIPPTSETFGAIASTFTSLGAGYIENADDNILQIRLYDSLGTDYLNCSNKVIVEIRFDPNFVMPSQDYTAFINFQGTAVSCGYNEQGDGIAITRMSNQAMVTNFHDLGAEVFFAHGFEDENTALNRFMTHPAPRPKTSSDIPGYLIPHYTGGITGGLASYLGFGVGASGDIISNLGTGDCYNSFNPTCYRLLHDRVNDAYMYEDPPPVTQNIYLPGTPEYNTVTQTGYFDNEPGFFSDSLQYFDTGALLVELQINPNTVWTECGRKILTQGFASQGSVDGPIGLVAFDIDSANIQYINLTNNPNFADFITIEGDYTYQNEQFVYKGQDPELVFGEYSPNPDATGALHTAKSYIGQSFQWYQPFTDNTGDVTVGENTLSTIDFPIITPGLVDGNIFNSQDSNGVMIPPSTTNSILPNKMIFWLSLGTNTDYALLEESVEIWGTSTIKMRKNETMILPGNIDGTPPSVYNFNYTIDGLSGDGVPVESPESIGLIDCNFVYQNQDPVDYQELIQNDDGSWPSSPSGTSGDSFLAFDIENATVTQGNDDKTVKIEIPYRSDFVLLRAISDIGPNFTGTYVNNLQNRIFLNLNLIDINPNN